VNDIWLVDVSLTLHANAGTHAQTNLGPLSYALLRIQHSAVWIIACGSASGQGGCNEGGGAQAVIIE